MDMGIKELFYFPSLSPTSKQVDVNEKRNSEMTLGIKLSSSTLLILKFLKKLFIPLEAVLSTVNM